MLMGSDPEMMPIDRLGNPIPVCSLLGGTKEHPIPVQHGAYQEDNVNAEFNIDPTDDEDVWVERHLSVIAQVEQVLAPHQITLAAIPSFHYLPTTLNDAGEGAMTMGCDRDLNVWTGKHNPKPNPFQSLRSSGGHIHFSCDRGQVEAMIKLLDFYLGIPSILMDADTERRAMYGQAGAHRVKPYGGEYRTLSNFWLRSPDLMRWAFRQTQRAKMDLHLLTPMLKRVDATSVQDIINNNLVDQAQDVCLMLGLEVIDAEKL